MKKAINIETSMKAYRKDKSISIPKALEDEIGEIQKRTRVRNIDAQDILNILYRTEVRLDIPKKYLEGVKVIVDANAQNFPSAYNYIPESTQFKAEYRKGWRITDVYRGQTKRLGHMVSITLTDEAKDKILERISAY